MFFISWFLCICTLSCEVQDRCAIGRLPPGKTPIGKKVSSPLKTHWGKLVGRVFQGLLAELGVLPRLGRLITHDGDGYDDDGDEDGDYDDVVMMPPLYCSLVIYNG